MFILSNLLIAIADLVSFALTIYMWIVVARAFVSWVSADPYNPIVRFLYAATEPVLYRIRRVIPLQAGGMDFSPILVFVGIFLLQRFFVRSLYDLAMALR